MRAIAVLLAILSFSLGLAAQPAADDPKAADVIKRAVTALGGERYLNVKTQVGRGKYSEISKEGVVMSFRSFLDVIAFPDKERTEFKGQGLKSIQVNTGDTGWIFDGSMVVLKDQGETQIANFKKGVRTSLDNLLRGGWRGAAKLEFVARRAGALGKRNDVVRLTYDDGLIVDFEFVANTGEPVKAAYKRVDADGLDVKEEDRYGQFIDVGGIKAPFVIDHYINGKITSRINFETIEFNRPIPDSAFAKPASAKQVKELKL
jgi:outer membrane lipoprotein-sorting protein